MEGGDGPRGLRKVCLVNGLDLGLSIKGPFRLYVSSTLNCFITSFLVFENNH